VKVVLQSNAIGVGTEEAFAEDIAQGSLALLHWRNLPQNMESMNARCGIVSRTGSPVASGEGDDRDVGGGGPPGSQRGGLTVPRARR
jgi:hypothetical protein